MRFLGILFILFFQLQVHGQLGLETYFTKENKQTKNIDDAHYMRTLTLTEGENAPVLVKEIYLSSQKTKLRGTYKSLKEKRFIGLKIQAYENGKTKSKENYSIDHKLIDTCYYYYPNGKLEIAYNYPYSIENNKTIVKDTLILVYNDSLGNRHLIDGNGYVQHNDSFSTESGNYVNHKKDGTWEGLYIRNKNTYTEMYKNGLLIKGETKDSLSNIIGTYDFKSIEQQPEYPGGIAALRSLIAEKYKYPDEAIKNRVKGTVNITFVVEKDGSMTNYEIKNDLGYGTGNEAIRILKKAKKWSPGYQRGIPVRVAYSLPIKLDMTR